jgi:hypothetical protein
MSAYVTGHDCRHCSEMGRNECTCPTVEDQISAYYRQCSERHAAAWSEYMQAVAEKRPNNVIQKLYEKAIDAGYTGD